MLYSPLFLVQDDAPGNAINFTYVSIQWLEQGQGKYLSMELLTLAAHRLAEGMKSPLP